MSIRIHEERCIGCGRCTEACPGNLLFLSVKGKAQIRTVEDCWGCTACMKEGPVSAIGYFLGADIGGRGGTMTIERDGHFYHWRVAQPGRDDVVITIDRQNANQY